MLDFEPERRRLRPDLFVVNEDGDVPAKQTLCRELGIDYVVLDRIPHGNLRARSTRCRIVSTWPGAGWTSRSCPGTIPAR